jgi:acyl-CoA thioester hydrolase
MDGLQFLDATVDPWEFHGRWPVRLYELDSNAHVNNAVYLNYVEQVALEHVEAMGYGRDWYQANGGGWFVREHHATYHLPATFGDFLLLTTFPVRMGAASADRFTEIRRESDRALLVEVLTVWAWVRADGRPGRIPAELRAHFEGGPPEESAARRIVVSRAGRPDSHRPASPTAMPARDALPAGAGSSADR